MIRRAHIFGFASALLLGAAFSTAQALDIGGISLGSGDSGGTAASVGIGDTSIDATIGGGSNIANASVGSGTTSVGASVGNTPGSLITTTSTGGTTEANVNLGSLGLGSTPNSLLNSVTDPAGNILDDPGLGGLLPGGGGGGGGVGGGGGGGAGGGGGGAVIAAGFAGLSGADQQILRARCGAVLANPGGFAANVVALCRVIASL